jgi:F0F1-type ATP synthase epsilon subunit
MSERTHIAVTVTEPNKVLWQGEATALQSVNSEGTFAIIPDHARFLTILKKVDIMLYEGEEVVSTIPVTEAVLSFENDAAQIFVQPRHAKAPEG